MNEKALMEQHWRGQCAEHALKLRAAAEDVHSVSFYCKGSVPQVGLGFVPMSASAAPEKERAVCAGAREIIQEALRRIADLMEQEALKE